MPNPPKRWLAAIVTTLAATLPLLAHALPLTPDANPDGYAGLASLTVVRSGPTPSSTDSGTAAAISGTTTFVMAWTGDGDAYAYRVGDSQFAIDFGSLLAGRAPVSLGRYTFDLSLDPVIMDLASVDLSGPSLGDVSQVLALAGVGGAYTSWTASETRGIFSASYRLFLFDSATETASSAAGPSALAIPEPEVLALIGIALVALAATRHTRKQ
ncbi:MAG TPA: PEP-CTERM sorting domain-containing protein [Aromatoleum sp.]|uniref:PEP-CTERM sorting domain-containing protein n=1 Tax=Aromatoleum sp. TaxID=2307007 RepID=UPI002B465833|nr:PEP-CTERM sorting domain-containing protein [Aromatoleum sp.]HJV28786.1 PEP-CTERM sorting domain-containing protein [Aromatoleum sp.]